MSVREIRGKRLAARGLEEPDAAGPDAPEVSEPEAARSAADQQRNRPARHRRVQEAPDDRQRKQQRDQSDGYEGDGRQEDERGRPLADDGFESLCARFGGDASSVPQPAPEAPADLSSLPTAEYEISEAGVPLGAPSSTGFEAIEILSQIVHGSAPTIAVPAVTMPELYPSASVLVTPAEEEEE